MCFSGQGPQKCGVMPLHYIFLVGLFSLSFLLTFLSNLGSLWSTLSRIQRFLWKLPAPSKDGWCQRGLASALGYAAQPSKVVWILPALFCTRKCTGNGVAAQGLLRRPKLSPAGQAPPSARRGRTEKPGRRTGSPTPLPLGSQRMRGPAASLREDGGFLAVVGPAGRSAGQHGSLPALLPFATAAGPGSGQGRLGAAGLVRPAAAAVGTTRV